MLTILWIALALPPPLYVIKRREGERRLKRPYLCSVLSFGACTAVVIQELAGVKRRVTAGDFGGIEDTISAEIILCVSLAAVTVLLNLIALALVYEEE